MPFIVAVIGILMVVVAINGTEQQFGKLFASEFSANNNFIWWLVSIAIIGSIGYIPKLEQPSRWFIALMIVVLLLANGGFIDKLNSAVQSASGNNSLLGLNSNT